MGTSSSHSGNKDNKGLLPSDYNGQQSKQEVSWQATKTGFSKYINDMYPEFWTHKKLN